MRASLRTTGKEVFMEGKKTIDQIDVDFPNRQWDAPVCDGVDIRAVPIPDFVITILPMTANYSEENATYTYLFTPTSLEADRWLSEHCAEPTRHFYIGKSLVVENLYVSHLRILMQADGLSTGWLPIESTQQIEEKE